MYFISGNTLLDMNAGTNLFAGASNSAFHAAQGVANGGSGALFVDGSSATGNTGTNGTGGGAFGLGNSSLVGQETECGVWPIGFNFIQQSNMNSNQHTYWGF
jgi:hypothetical protein